EALADRAVVFERARAAVDVDRGVDLGVARIALRDPEILVAIGDEDLGDLAEEGRALGEAQLAQIGPADAPRVVERRAVIDAVGGGARELVARDRIDERRAGAPALGPLAGDVILELHGVSLLRPAITKLSSPRKRGPMSPPVERRRSASQR